MIEVEIKGRFGQYIKAILLNATEDDAIVTYPSREGEERVPLSIVRLPVPPNREVHACQEAEVLFAFADFQNGGQSVDFGDLLTGNVADEAAAKSDIQSLLIDHEHHFELPAWWPCRVQKVRDEVAVVKLHVSPPPNASPEEANRCSLLSNVTDIVNRSTLRHPSTESPTISASMIHRHCIDIPKELSDFAADTSVHTDFLRHCGGPTSLFFDSESSKLVVLSTDEKTIRNVGLLEETHLKMLRQKWAITRSLRQTMRSLDAARGSDGAHAHLANTRSSGDSDVDPSLFVEKFYVPQRLMGLAIGGQGSNIRAARELPGVVSVRLRESDDDRRTVDLVDHGDAALFIVEAKTPEAAKLARAKLEFTELYLGVPRRYVGRLIGRRTNNIQSIINKSGVVQIHFDDHIKGPSDDEVISNLETLNLSHSSQFAFNMRRVFLRAGGTQPTSQPHADEEYGGFILSGTRDSVEKAKLLISFQLDYIFDLEKMEAEKNAIMSNLSYTNTELGGGYAPRGYLDGPGRFGDRGGAGIRGIGSGGAGAGRGIRRPPRRNYPAGNFDNGFVDGPRPSEQYADDGPAPFGNSRRPPRDPRSTRGYNGESRIGRARGGRMRRGIGAPRGHTEWNDRTGTNGDVADRRRGSDDSDAMGSNLSHDIDSDEHDGIASYSRDNQPIKRDIGETTDEDNLPGGDESAGHNSNDNSRLRDSDRSNCNRYEYSNQPERPVRYNRPPRTRQTLQNGSSVSASSGSALKHTGATSVRQPTQA